MNQPSSDPVLPAQIRGERVRAVYAGAIDLDGQTQRRPGEVQPDQTASQPQPVLPDGIRKAAPARQLHKEGLGVTLGWWGAGWARPQHRRQPAHRNAGPDCDHVLESGQRGAAMPKSPFDSPLEDVERNHSAEIHQGSTDCGHRHPEMRAHVALRQRGHPVGRGRTGLPAKRHGHLDHVRDNTVHAPPGPSGPSIGNGARTGSQHRTPERRVPSRGSLPCGVDAALDEVEGSLLDEASPLVSGHARLAQLSGADGKTLAAGNVMPVGCHITQHKTS
jgi:hypothetical protein